MSDPDPHPAETLCAPSTGTVPPVALLEPRDVPLGGLRAMNVRRTLPQRERSLIGAWCFLDHYGPDDVASTGGMNVPAHPHIGLQTVSWLFSGEIEHRDSAGFHASVRPGELNLMTAGSGISHSERSTPGTTVLHGAQLWIALPGDARHGPRGFEHYAPPVTRGEGWAAQVFLGSLLGDVSPVLTHTPLVGAELRIDPGETLVLDVDPRFEHGILVDSGATTIAPESGDAGLPATSGGERSWRVEPDRLAYVAAGPARIRLTADDAGARILIIGGEPFGEDIVMWWNLVGRSHDEIARARADWQREIAASGVGDPSAGGEPVATADRDGFDDRAPILEGTRFGLPEQEPEPPLPAPRLPSTRLIPRRNRD